MKRHWELDELVEHWTLLPNELALVGNKTDPNRLGFAVLLKFFQIEARFPVEPQEVPDVVVQYIAQLVGVLPEKYGEYDWNGRTTKYHRTKIRSLLGFRSASVQDTQSLTKWLIEQVLPVKRELEYLITAFLGQCRAWQIEPPTSGRIERLVRSALHTYEERFCHAIYAQLSPKSLAQMEALLEPPEVIADDTEHLEGLEQGRAVWLDLKASLGKINLDSVQSEIGKLERLRTINLPSHLFAHVPPKILHAYRTRAFTEEIYELRRLC